MVPEAAAGPLIWVAVGLALVLGSLVAVLAAMLDRSGPIRVRSWAEQAGGRLRRLKESAPHLEAFRFLLSVLARVLPLVLLVALYLGLAGGGVPAATAWALAGAAGWMVFTEWLVRVLVAGDPETVLRKLSAAYRWALWVLTPLVRLLAPLVKGVKPDRREDEDQVSDEEIEAYIDVGTREGILEPGEDDLIMRVIDFGDALVKSVITPRIDMVCAPADSSLDELAELFLETKHSRIPLYQESVDQVVGVLHIRDLLGGLRSPHRPPAAELAMPAYVVPETKPLNELLREFQSTRQQLALVVDEYGGTVGLVTVEDLLEEIVGEIVDEHEEISELNRELPDGSWKLDGATPLDSLHVLFGVEVEGEPYETVGGLFFGRLGHVPEAGDQIEALGLSLIIDRVEGRRIKSVIARPLSADPGEPS